jgi:stress-induced-phosphoprotein 1
MSDTVDRTDMSAADCKGKGNEFLKVQDYDNAISWYTTAIEKDPSQHVYYSNRSAAYLQKGNAEAALADGEACINAKGDWPKGYNRKGCAYHALKKYDEAIATFEAGLKIAPGSTLLTGPLKEAQTAKDNAAANAGSQSQMPNVFGPDMWAKLKANPETAAWLEDPKYVQLLKLVASNPAIQQNPQMIQQLGDQRLLQTMLFLMGMPLNMGMPGGPGYTGPPPEKKQKPEPEPEKVKELTPEEKAQKEIRDAGSALKDEGNEFFKAKNYTEAIAKYEAAEQADPTLMTYRTNIASCYHALGKYAEAIAECDRALDIGMEHYNDYKLKAKAMERQANAYWKMEEWDKACEKMEKAQFEVHDDKRYSKLKKWKKNLGKKKAEAYLDPAKALEAKEAGNIKFAAKDFKGAIDLYTEAIKRDPTNPAYFCNRCAAYQKTMDMNEAVKDANSALKLDPKYIKAYSR